MVRIGATRVAAEKTSRSLADGQAEGGPYRRPTRAFASGSLTKRPGPFPFLEGIKTEFPVPGFGWAESGIAVESRILIQDLSPSEFGCRFT